MIKKYILISLIFFLIYNNSVVYATEIQETKQIVIPINDDTNKQSNFIISQDDNFIETCLSAGEINDQILFMLLTKILEQPDFLLPNKNYWLIKLFFLVISPLFASINNLVIAVNSNITPKLILVTQYAVPLYIINIYRILDKLKLNFSPKIKKIICNIKKNKIKTTYSLANISLSIYLAYLSTLIDAKASGDAYTWIFSQFTDSKITLDISYNLGYFITTFFKIALNSVFFFNLINEIFHKTGIGYLMNVTPSLKYNDKELSYYHHKNNLKDLIRYNNTEIAINKATDYLTNHNLNTVLDIANLQVHCYEENYHRKSVTNIYINSLKFCFIIAIGAFCAEASRQIFTSKLILKEFIENHANRTINGSYSFLLNNNKVFICNSIDNCINTMDINAIDVVDTEITDILSLNRDGIIANSLKGIAISVSTAEMLIMFVTYAWKIKTKTAFKKTLLNSYFQTKNIVPAITAGTLLISGYYYMENIYDVSDVAETSNNLLHKAQHVTFMPVTASVALTISALTITFSRGMSFLVDITRTIMNLFCDMYGPT